MKHFLGFRRPDGRAGIRNQVLILAVDECADGIARAISQKVPGTVVVTNYNTCMYGGNEELINTMTGAALNPNVAGALILNMGCGSIDPELLAEQIRGAGKPVHCLPVIKSRGTRITIVKGIELAKQLTFSASQITAEKIPFNELVVGIKCGGSDTSSGIASNPAVGRAADQLVDLGATCIAGELIELIGCEDILRSRAVTPQVADKIEQLISEEEKRWHIAGTEIETMSIGNSVGGLTTLEEKAIGALHKTGTRPIQDILKINSKMTQRPTRPGMYLSETTHLCGGSGMHFASLGAQVILWTTGGAGFNNPIVPVIRISGNASQISEDIDVDVSAIMSGSESITSSAERIMDTLEKVAQGQATAIEDIGFSYCTLYQKEQRLEKVICIEPQ
ncbi:UxaA family hydrolase [Psychromonas aquimarina]|uniref:UxaA family hydrolase n=1 Tax=Psychromonas aquimarina TaxID=444919 RepID=UPI000418F86D|nr:UxaA family hydrolase [Psychromonas aquimarina]